MKFFVIVLGAALLATHAQAQQTSCTKQRDQMLQQLERKHAEQPTALGLSNIGGVLEVLTSKGGTSWTIIHTMPSGLTCAIAAGEHWERLPRSLVRHSGPQS